MAVYKLARFRARPETRGDVERAMHDYASYVRKELPDSSWTVYRDPNASTQYVAVMRAESPAADQRQRTAPGTQSFIAAVSAHLVGDIEYTDCELVTSSDLQRRHRGR